MPRGDGTGPDGKGPKKTNKGWPKKDGTGQGGNRKRKGLLGNVKEKPKK